MLWPWGRNLKPWIHALRYFIDPLRMFRLLENWTWWSGWEKLDSHGSSYLIRRKCAKTVLLGILHQKSGIDSSHMTWWIQHDGGWNGWNGRIFSAFCYLFKHHQLSIPSHQQVSLPDVELSGMLLDIGFSSPQARENSSHWGDTTPVTFRTTLVRWMMVIVDGAVTRMVPWIFGWISKQEFLPGNGCRPVEHLESWLQWSMRMVRWGAEFFHSDSVRGLQLQVD